MKILFIKFILFFLLAINSRLYSQIDWDKLYWGASAQFSVTGGDLNKYWGNYFSPGLLLQYQLDDQFIFEIDISGSFLKPSEENKNIMPEIFLVNSLGILKYNFIDQTNFRINLSPGFTNTAFVFTGDAADRLEDNFIEYEFGIYMASGIELKLADKFFIEIFISAQNIFSSPSNLVFYSSGLKIIFR